VVVVGTKPPRPPSWPDGEFWRWDAKKATVGVSAHLPCSHGFPPWWVRAFWRQHWANGICSHVPTKNRRPIEEIVARTHPHIARANSSYRDMFFSGNSGNRCGIPSVGAKKPVPTSVPTTPPTVGTGSVFGVWTPTIGGYRPPCSTRFHLTPPLPQQRRGGSRPGGPGSRPRLWAGGRAWSGAGGLHRCPTSPARPRRG
jgi:hypothetical protein